MSPDRTCAGKSDAWIAGFQEAERQFYDDSRNCFTSPFDPDSQEHAGWLEGVYTFTQK